MKKLGQDRVHEIKHLQRCINDLVSLMALPAIWSGHEPSQIVEMLLDALLNMLGLEFVCARLDDPVTAAPVEILRVAESCKLKVPRQDIGVALAGWLKRDREIPLPPTSAFGEKISIVPVPLGVHGEIGMIVVGSERENFPSQTESLLLTVAANQASIALREAVLLNEQKQIASELDRRVVQRTAELAATNEELRREIAERKLAETLLSQSHAQAVRSEEKWRSVFENSAVGVALADLNGRFIGTNPVFQKMVGYTDDELRQLTFLEITHEDNVEHNRALIRDLVGGKRQQFQVENQYRRKDGQAVWARNNVSILPGTDREPRFLMALSEDITQRKLSEDALAKARLELTKVASITSLGVLTASIAHEVNQPLSGIITNANTCLRMLSADPANIDGARETVRRTIRDGRRASEVITRLRTLYSKKDPIVEAMDLNEAAREVTALSSTEIQKNGVTLRQELADDLAPAFGDRIQLQQVILNLVRNAVDSMSTIDSRPRELLIRTEWDNENQVRLSVRDSGAGLTPEAADRIFEAFYTTKSDGMGIGLSVSRSIIEAHQGRLWATPNDGPGCTFSFAIPCMPKALADEETGRHPADSAADAA